MPSTSSWGRRSLTVGSGRRDGGRGGRMGDVIRDGLLSRILPMGDADDVHAMYDMCMMSWDGEVYAW